MWLTILLALLPLLVKLFEYLFALKEAGKKLEGRQAARVNEVIWYCDQLNTLAPEIGCVRGGTPPERQTPTEEETEVWPDVSATAVPAKPV